MLNKIILDRIMTSIANQSINPNFASAIHPEMLLLTACLEMEDTCWEQRLRAGMLCQSINSVSVCLSVCLYMYALWNVVFPYNTVVSLFQCTQHQRNPVVMEYVTLPCLNILKSIVSPSVQPSGKAHEVGNSSYSDHMFVLPYRFLKDKIFAVSKNLYPYLNLNI